MQQTSGASRGRGWVVAGELASLLCITAMAVWRLRPTMLDPTFVSPQRDAAFTAIALQHLQRALTGEVALLDAPLGYPSVHSLTQADWMLGQALFTLPLSGVDPVRLGPLAALVGIVLSAWALHHVARVVWGPGPHTLLAPLLGGLGAMTVDNAQHLNLVWHAPATWGVLLLCVGGVARRVGPAAMGGLLVGLSAHFGLYTGAHALALAGLALVSLGRWPGVRGSTAAGVGLLLGLLTVAPVLSLYLDGAAALGAGTGALVDGEGAWNPLHAWAVGTRAPAAESWRPAIPLVLLAVLALRQWCSEARPLLIIAGASALLALGAAPVIGSTALPVPGPHALLDAVTGGQLRAPGRWLFWTEAALGVLACGAVARTRRTVALMVLVGVGISIATRPPLRAVPRAGIPQSTVFAELSETTPGGAVFERFGPGGQGSGLGRLHALLAHPLPVVVGHYARVSPVRSGFIQAASRWPEPDADRLLRAAGVSTVVFYDADTDWGTRSDGVCVVGSDGSWRCPLGEPPRVAVPLSDGGAEDRVQVVCADGHAETVFVDGWQALAALQGASVVRAWLDDCLEPEPVGL